MNTLPKKNDSTLEHALTYAKNGWSVLPVHGIHQDVCTCGKECGSPGKHPATKHGVTDASRDEGQIRKWFNNSKAGNIGIATGETSGIFVLDVDDGGDKTIAEWEVEHGPLPETLMQRTGSGGTHYLFRHPGFKVSNRAKTIGAGLDIRGDGGYIVAPPSNHVSGGVYQWLNTFPLAEAPAFLLDKSNAGKTTDRQAESNPDGPTIRSCNPAYVKKALENEVQKVADAENNSRNDALNKAAFALGQFVGADALDRSEMEGLLTGAAKKIGLTEGEIIATIKSGLDSGIKNPRIIPPPGFEVRKDGIFLLDKNGKEIFICSPLRVSARTRDADQLNHGYLLEFKDADGHPHKWSVPAAILQQPREFKSVLMSMGLIVSTASSHNDHLSRYIMASKPSITMRCVDRIGWFEWVFVLPEETIGGDHE